MHAMAACFRVRLTCEVTERSRLLAGAAVRSEALYSAAAWHHGGRR
jgi:hypothetical protein